MLEMIRLYFEGRKRVRSCSADFFRGGMHCPLVPLSLTRKNMNRWM